MRTHVNRIKATSKPYWVTYKEGKRPLLHGFWFWLSKRKRAFIMPDEVPF